MASTPLANKISKGKQQTNAHIMKFLSHMKVCQLQVMRILICHWMISGLQLISQKVMWCLETSAQSCWHTE